MDWNLVMGMGGLILSVIGLAYAVYEKRKSKREKNLVYEVIPPVPAAEVIEGQSNYSLRVVYERPDEEPVNVENATIQYIRFTNFGKIPITRSDLAQADPLRLEISVTDGTILDVSLVSATRDVCQITTGQQRQDNNITSVVLDFDFLDYQDGGLIQVLSDTQDIETALRGTVVGMPSGIRETKVLTEPSEVPSWGCAVWAAIVVLGLVATPFIYRSVIGSWDCVWLLSLPLAALLLPSIFFSLILIVLEPRAECKFPERLVLPPWYHMRREYGYMYERRQRSREGESRSSNKGNEP